MKEYLQNPNLPLKKVGGVLVDYRIRPEAEQNLMRLGIQVYKTLPCCDIQIPVNGHPDMTLHHLGERLFVSAPNLYPYYKNLLSDASIIPGNTKPGKHYPNDIAYNIARIGKYAFHKLQSTDFLISEYFRNNGVTLINIPQGYAKCSICMITENAIMTSDTIIAKQAKQHGFDVLLIHPGFIRLKGYNYGFLGGASGLIDRHTLAVNGQLAMHPDYNQILAFCQKYDVQIYPLHNEIPEDIGSIIPLFYQ